MKRRMWRHRERNYVWTPDNWEKKKKLEEQIPSKEEWDQMGIEDADDGLNGERGPVDNYYEGATPEAVYKQAVKDGLSHAEAQAEAWPHQGGWSLGGSIANDPAADKFRQEADHIARTEGSDG